ncbi:LLM class flavin-dependent oxidoreductase [Sinorhizobium mexicanum]|nr:LLM class flavin-dependent oxidoreductase [Sinorhizobium mexicanum]MBP1884367.1 alkanesulfonate monooxygenase SsuD/methylene tetrahydromethanopterin reductase-like flavin-dependent oxidoreductase (luciferase family) [Sinorhizobium mexicanum]
MEFGVLDHLDISSKLPLAEHYENRIRFVEALERSGFYAYHVTEHHCTPLGGSGSPSVVLSALIQRTKSIRLGTMVYSLPTHHPIRLIEEICLLDQLSCGRLDIGFGRGSVPFELTYFGVDPSEAQEIYSEALEVITGGLREKRLEFDGKHFKFGSLQLALESLQKPMPPRWYGVHSVESAERAARAGFNIVCNQPSKNSAQYIAAFRTTLREVRPTEPLPHIGLNRAVYVAPTREQAIETVQRAYSAFLHSFRHVTRRHGVQNRVSGLENDFLELMAVGRGIAGTPRDVADFLAGDLAASGANFCSLQLAFGDLTADEMNGSLHLFASEVMPRLRTMADSSAA